MQISGALSLQLALKLLEKQHPLDCFLGSSRAKLSCVDE